MSKYTFNFSFDIGERVLDLITKQEAEIIGVVYVNGIGIKSEFKFFHDESYTIRLPGGIRDIRTCNELEKI
ncbi:MAG: hypothetical protein WC516_05695 [Patescibacteria group bacterium]|jgi:hypothetical protein